MPQREPSGHGRRVQNLVEGLMDLNFNDDGDAHDDDDHGGHDDGDHGGHDDDGRGGHGGGRDDHDDGGRGGHGDGDRDGHDGRGGRGGHDDDALTLLHLFHSSTGERQPKRQQIRLL
ncbi:hypothetical protein TNCT_292751 [Trichonephila clavata]|uniref:Uncharacterized protein n=1 Tax=Trichonephila clavata TaxID=2740835 RepID=A0A8X6FYG4_TRICU|nr:hypothetical protein TNCT_292751 [Trichonephila clavata]